MVEKAIRKVFPPEFINRVDEQVYFNSLSKEDIEKIIDIELKDLRHRVQDAGFEINVTPAAKRLVADAGYDPKYGARPLKRAIQKYIEDPISEQIISDRMNGTERKDGRLRVSVNREKTHTTVEWKED